jgi:hypothetical protein
MVMLPNDVERCAGVGNDHDGWREGCEDCARRLAESTIDVSTWMIPPAIIAFWCEFRIKPNAQTHLTDAADGRSGGA